MAEEASLRPTARISGSAKRKAAAAEVWNSYIESKKQRYRAGLLRRFCFFIKPFKDNPCRYGRAQPPYMAVQGLPGGLVQKTANGTYSAFIGLPDFILAHAGQAHGYPGVTKLHSAFQNPFPGHMIGCQGGLLQQCAYGAGVNACARPEL